MYTKGIGNKNGVSSIENTTLYTYEKSIFNLLKIDLKLFDQSVNRNSSYAVLLRSWIKECHDQNISPQIVAKKINKSGVLIYIELNPKTKIAA